MQWINTTNFYEIIMVSYDDQLSYIKSGSVDHIVNAIDDEMAFNVSNLELYPNPTPTSDAEDLKNNLIYQFQKLGIKVNLLI